MFLYFKITIKVETKNNKKANNVIKLKFITLSYTQKLNIDNELHKLYDFNIGNIFSNPLPTTTSVIIPTIIKIKYDYTKVTNRLLFFFAVIIDILI